MRKHRNARRTADLGAGIYWSPEVGRFLANRVALRSDRRYSWALEAQLRTAQVHAAAAAALVAGKEVTL